MHSILDYDNSGVAHFTDIRWLIYDAVEMELITEEQEVPLQYFVNELEADLNDPFTAD